MNVAGSGGCFASVSAAIADAGTIDGDTITVAAGTYNEPQLLINKGVEIVGAGMGTTVIDGNAAAQPSLGMLRLMGNADQAVRDLTIRDTGGTSPTLRASVGIKTLAPAEVVFDEVEIIGRGTGGSDYGIYAENSTADLEIANSRITGTAFNPLLIERHRGATDIHDNFISAPFSVFFMAHSGDNVTAPQRLTDNEIISTSSAVGVTGGFTGATNGSFSDFQITGNDITSGSAGGIGLTNASNQAGGANGLLSDFVVTGNRITSSAPTPVAASRGIGLSGAVDDTVISGNTITGFETGVRAVTASAGHSQDGTELAFNRIAGNTTPVLNNSSSAIQAEDNWWGCNAGPGDAACGSFAGSSATDGAPWLVLSASASPASIQTGGQTSAITADLTRDSDGGTPTGNAFPDGTTIDFATSLGTIGPVSAGTAAAGAASTLTSGATAGTATVTATLDNQAVTTPVTFTTPPTTPTDQGGGGNNGGGSGGGGTVPPPSNPGGQVEPAAAATLSLAGRTVKIDRLGRFTIDATTGGPGVLVARGTAKASGVASRRLVGKRLKVGAAGTTKVQLRLARATRLQLLSGKRVSATVTMVLTPPREGRADTKSVTFRVTR